MDTLEMIAAATQTLQAADDTVDFAEPSVGRHQKNDSRHLGPFLLEQRLGRGAMGEVWLAIDSRSGTQVALKLALDNSQEAQLIHEAEILEQLEHPGIVVLQELFSHLDRTCLVLEVVPGRTLQDLIQAGERVSLDTVLDWLQQLSEILSYCHGQGIVHGDIKPANVILRDDGQLVVIDFGLARRLPSDVCEIRPSELAGSPAYMAPELLRAEPGALSPQLDVFSLGMLLYELLTGRTPFRGNIFEVVRQILSQDPSPPSQLRSEIPEHLDRLTLRMISRERDQRIQDMNKVAVALSEG